MTPGADEPGIGSGRHPGADKLIDFVLGDLDSEQSALVRSHVEACASCESELMKVFADRERSRIGGAAIAQPPEPVVLPASRDRARTRPAAGAWLAVAAVAAALVAVFALPFRGRSLELVWLPSTADALEGRGTAPTERDALVWQGLSAYGKHDLDHALQWLDGDPASDPGLESLRRLHLASARLLTGDARRALQAIDGMGLDQLPHPWRGEARWLRACALARLGRSDEARAELQRLALETGDAAERARRALDQPLH